MRQSPDSKRLRKGRHSESQRVYLVTSVTDDRQPYLASLLPARVLIRQFMVCEQAEYAKTLAFVVMPDHFHWLMQLGERESLSSVVQRVKSCATRTLRSEGYACVWQQSFHDHAVRQEEDVRRLARYVVANPLRAGLVKRVADYSHWDCIWLP